LNRLQDAADLLVKAVDIQKMERYVQLAYLFHPYVIANCAARTTTGNAEHDFRTISRTNL
jgi:hypothetical protein